MALSFGTVSSLIGGTTGGANAQVTVNSAGSSGVLALFQGLNGSGGVNTLTSTHLTWTLQSSHPAGASTDYLNYWTAPFTSQVTSEVVSYLDNTVISGNFNVFVCVEIAGAATSSIRDPNNVTPPFTSGQPADPIAITTSNANDAIIAAFRQNSTAAPTKGTIGGATTNGLYSGQASSFMLVEGLIVSSTQSAASCTITTGATDSNNSVVDAIVQSGGGGGGNKSHIGGLMMGLGAMVGWRAPLVGGVGLRAAKLLQSGQKVTRRRLLTPGD